MNNLIEFLKQEGVSAQLVEEVRHYSEEHTVDEALKKRIPVPHFHYYGNKVWEEALAVLLSGRREGNGKKCACTESCSSF